MDRRLPADPAVGYALEQHEGMASGVRRIVREQLAGAVDQLEGRADRDRDEAVHDARKRLKKARSALRLVRDDLGNGLRRRENAVMRDAGRRLSGVRDAHVLVETLDALAQDRDGPELAPEAVGALRSELVDRRSELRAAAAEQEQGYAAAAHELSALLERVDEWPLEDESFASAREGLARIYERGRRAMGRAFGRGQAEAWHAWRKRVKDLWYCARILEPVAPHALGGTVKEADRLSDLLGEQNDLEVLDTALSEHAEALDPGQLELLRAAIARRRDALRLHAVPLGRRLYAEKPVAFTRRLARYWDAREADAVAQAHWLPPELATLIRSLLVEKQSAAPAERRRIAAELRELGFRMTDFADQVPRRAGGFSAADFDLLLARGVIRLGEPPAPRAVASGDSESSARAAPGAEAPQSHDGGAPGSELLRLGVDLAATTARWARRSLRF